MRFRPTEVLLSPTADCNLHCAHCQVPRSKTRLPVKIAGSFLSQCKDAGVRRVSFTGGEPFLETEALCSLVRAAVRRGMLFGRIMTNGIWYKDADHLRRTLTALYEAGYDGDICLSVDAFHGQDVKKLGRFIKTAVSVWRRPDIVSIAWTGGAREYETSKMLERIKRYCGGAFLKMTRIDLSPIGTAQQIKDPWGSRWFKEDRCRGPGNVFMVEPSGDVKPCCGYASDSKEFTIGNIRKDTARDMIRRFDKEGVPGSIFRIGLSRIRKRLEKLGIKFPGRSDNHCFFCSYILTKIPRKILNRAILACLLAALLVSQSWAEQSMARKSEDCRQIKFSVKQKIELPKWYHEGLFIDGDSMLVANGNGGKIWRVDTASGKVTSQIRSPSGFTEAIAKMPGGGYMLTDWDDEKLYKIKFTGTDIAIEGVLFDFTPAHPAGAVIAGGRIFVIVWTRGLGTRFDIIELDKDIKEVSRIRVMDFQEPAHMAWDGRYLWITSWYDRNVYKVNPDTWTIISYFRAPCNKPTGIAWDGKYIWITGTYADLYKVELESASD